MKKPHEVAKANRQKWVLKERTTKFDPKVIIVHVYDMFGEEHAHIEDEYDWLKAVHTDMQAFFAFYHELHPYAGMTWPSLHDDTRSVLDITGRNPEENVP